MFGSRLSVDVEVVEVSVYRRCSKYFMLSGGVKEKIGRDVRRGDWINFRWC